jgi:predicted nucleotidyltransferase
MLKVYKIKNKRIDTSATFFVETDEDNLLDREPFFGSWTTCEKEFDKDADIQLLVEMQKMTNFEKLTLAQ